MDKEEYKAAVSEIKIECDDKLSELAKKCAISNNTVKIGDVITDHMSKIEVESISYAFGYGSGLPCCQYRGKSLKIDGKPFKSGEYETIYQSNIKGIT